MSERVSSAVYYANLYKDHRTPWFLRPSARQIPALNNTKLVHVDAFLQSLPLLVRLVGVAQGVRSESAICSEFWLNSTNVKAHLDKKINLVSTHKYDVTNANCL